MTVWVVAGPAGVGKSTLGRALAERTGAVLLDLDTVTNPVLDALQAAWRPARHWNADADREVVRPARYAALLAVAADQHGRDLVLVAPFTRELAGGEEWDALVTAVGSPEVVWLTAPDDVLERRRSTRGQARDGVGDAGRARQASTRPVVPHRVVDAALPTADQLRQLVAR